MFTMLIIVYRNTQDKRLDVFRFVYRLTYIQSIQIQLYPTAQYRPELIEIIRLRRNISFFKGVSVAPRYLSYATCFDCLCTDKWRFTQHKYEPLKSALLNSNPHTTRGKLPTLLFLFALPSFCTVQCYLFCVFVHTLCSAVTGHIENSILFMFFYIIWITGKLKTNYLTEQNRHLWL